MVRRTVSWAMALSLVAIAAGGCAKGNNFDGTGGSSGGDGGTAGAAASGAGAGGAGDTGGGGSGTGTTSDTDTGSTSDTGTTSSTSSTSSTSMTTTTDTGCPMGQHECSGQCFGNTPQTGCYQSVSCAACVPPANGVSNCSADGLCDFTCNAGYNKQGAVCACAQGCCSNADCGANEVCQGGTCIAAVACTQDEQDACQAQCFAQCFIMMKIGIGSCNSGMCGCMCLG